MSPSLLVTKPVPWPVLPPQVNNMPMMALVSPVYDCLFRLAQPDSLSREEEVGGPGMEGSGGGQPLAQFSMPVCYPRRLSRASLPGAGAWWGHLRLVGYKTSCQVWNLSSTESSQNLLAQRLPSRVGKPTHDRNGESLRQLWKQVAQKPRQVRQCGDEVGLSNSLEMT